MILKILPIVANGFTNKYDFTNCGPSLYLHYEVRTCLFYIGFPEFFQSIESTRYKSLLSPSRFNRFSMEQLQLVLKIEVILNNRQQIRHKQSLCSKYQWICNLYVTHRLIANDNKRNKPFTKY